MSKNQPIQSIKFGGTSMGSAEMIRQCAKIVAKASDKSAVVVTVSAVSGVTNRLLELITLAKKQKPRLVQAKLLELETLHQNILRSFFENAQAYDQIWEEDFLPIFEKLNAILHGTSLVGDLTAKMKAKVCSFGECLSSFFLLYALQEQGLKTTRIHSEKVIKTDSEYLEANVNFKATQIACKKHIAPLLRQKQIPIVTGFIGKDTHGDTTLLGRGGSDYTASILAVALGASEVQIWTDVNGVMSADPRAVSAPVSWPKMGVKMMSEMAYSGAKIAHPRSIAIAVSNNIPVYIFNTFNLGFEGTKIVSQEVKRVKGIVTSDQNILFHLENPNMLDEVGFIAKVTSIVQEYNVPIDVCSTSETSFTFSISETAFHPKLEKELAKIGLLNVIRNIAKVSLIGQDITTDASVVFEKVFTLCHQKRIPIRSVSVGASQRNITLMIDQQFKDLVLKEMHKQWIEMPDTNLGKETKRESNIRPQL